MLCNEYITLIHSPIDGYLGYLFSIIKNATMNILVPVVWFSTPRMNSQLLSQIGKP